MKKFFLFLFCFIFVFFSCKEKQETSLESPIQESVIQESEIQESEIPESWIQESKNLETEKKESNLSAKKIDFDFTQMNYNLLYAQIFNMIMDGAAYNGKTIKISGFMQTLHDEQENKDYPSCVISDATQCCVVGLEYVLKEGQSYPKEGEKITVVGVFAPYKIHGYDNYHLVDAELL